MKIKALRFIPISKIVRVMMVVLPIFIFQLFFGGNNAYAQGVLPLPNINIGVAETPTEAASSLQILFALTIISLSPFILLMLTSFTRIIIAMYFLRSALGTQQMPPNQIMIGLALFLTLFLMSPTLTNINDMALQPLSRGEITTEQAVEQGLEPLREFMLRQIGNNREAINMFSGLAGEQYATPEEIPYSVLIPSFIVNEITIGFGFGFMIYLPFIVIDMVVSSTLMAMGMMMLPPAMISLPFKLLLFLMVGGWNVVIEMLLKTFS